ncbi:MAG: hypothetical protein ACOX4I_03995 [Anaerovoracaceae bacterium]|jgi:hypothetical protein
MKTNKSRILALAVIAVLVLCFAAACGNSDSPYVGKWKAASMVLGGNEVNINDSGVKLEMILDVKSDGKVTVKTDGTDGTGKWEEKDGKIVITDSSDAEMEGKIGDDKNLHLTVSDIEVIFEKQ